LTETLTVKYTKRATRKSGENFDTHEIGGEWEFTVPDGGDVDSAYGGGLAVLKTIVDKQFVEVENVPAPTPTKSYPEQQREFQERVFTKEEDAPAAKRSSEYRTFEPGSTRSDIVEGEAVMLENVKVWEVYPEEKTRNGKRYQVVRVGNKNNIPGTGYARVKSFEPAIINKLVALTENDHINVFGHFEHWMGRESVEGNPDTYMWDFIPERIEKA